MKKKYIIGLLTLIFAFSILTGCGANENGGFDLSSEIVVEIGRASCRERV